MSFMEPFNSIFLFLCTKVPFYLICVGECYNAVFALWIQSFLSVWRLVEYSLLGELILSNLPVKHNVFDYLVSVVMTAYSIITQP